MCSAAAIVLPVGAFTTSTPARIAASTSIRSIPTLATPTTLRRGAAASRSSASTPSLRADDESVPSTALAEHRQQLAASMPKPNLSVVCDREMIDGRLSNRLDDKDAGHGRSLPAVGRWA